ncbi:MAG: mechanosensitive ion channel, partial [Alphaproteobacteria bacterium]|nr:mechanosensitive ion channel [Rickettsiales bacterium]
LVPIFISASLLLLSKKHHFRAVVHKIIHELLTKTVNIKSKIRYSILKTILFASIPVTVIVLLLLVAAIFETFNLPSNIINVFITILSGYVLLKSMIIFSEYNSGKSSFFLTMFVIFVQTFPAISNNIKLQLSTVKVTVIGSELSFYSVIATVTTFLILRLLVELILKIGEKLIKHTVLKESHKSALQYKIFSYAVSFIALMFILSVLGLKASHIAVFGGAIGVGIGFGLQKIASNFISGMILLAEKNIRIGDIMEIEDGQIGTVKSLGVRAMVVTTFDGKDMIIPNELMIHSTATNYTLIDKKVRLSANFYIVNKKDTRKAIEVMRQACLTQREISREDPLVCCARDVKEYGIHLMSLFWISDFQQDEVLKIKSNIITTTLLLMEKNNIELYFEKSLSILRDTIHRVTNVNLDSQSPFVNRFQNTPLRSSIGSTGTNEIGRKPFSDTHESRRK